MRTPRVPGSSIEYPGEVHSKHILAHFITSFRPSPNAESQSPILAVSGDLIGTLVSRWQGVGKEERVDSERSPRKKVPELSGLEGSKDLAYGASPTSVNLLGSGSV
jgi:hypothetical protein